MSQTLTIAIPMAGYGSRLRPHTWSKPKVMLPLAGKTVLDHVLDQFNSLPQGIDVEYVFIVGLYGDQILEHMHQKHPEKKVRVVVQEQMRGQSDALYRAREYLDGPMLMVFADTLVETDLSFLKNDQSDGVIMVTPVEDPRRFGVAVLRDGWVERLIEKPQTIENNLVVVGFYYFKSGGELVDAIEDQMRRDISLRGEYFLADAVNILLERGRKIRVERVKTWLDAGIPQTMISTNRYLLEHGYANNDGTGCRTGVTIIPPVFIDDTASIESSVIGPNVSIGANCVIDNCILHDTVVDSDAHLRQVILQNSLLGRRVQLNGSALSMNIGDNASWISD